MSWCRDKGGRFAALLRSFYRVKMKKSLKWEAETWEIPVDKVWIRKLQRFYSALNFQKVINKRLPVVVQRYLICKSSNKLSSHGDPLPPSLSPSNKRHRHFPIYLFNKKIVRFKRRRTLKEWKTTEKYPRDIFKKKWSVPIEAEV